MVKTDYTREWLEFINYDIGQRIKALREKLEDRKKELGSEKNNESNE